MRQVLGILIVSLFFNLSLALAQTVEIPLRGGERFLLKAYGAQVTWINTPGTHLRVKGLSESQGVRRGDQLVFDLKELGTKNDFAQMLKKKGDALKVEITGPSMPVEINLREGSVKMTQMNHEVKIQMIQGHVTHIKPQGPVTVRLHRGQVNVQAATAKVSLEVYSGQVTLKDVVDSEVDLFSGQLGIQNLKGTLLLTTQSATSKISGMSGTLTLDSQKGVLSLTKFQGRLEGHIQDGNLSAQLLSETEVQLKSQGGRFSFQLPKESGAFVNVSTGEGDLQVPSELKVNRLPSEKIAKGRLRGESKKISITARTIDGAVTIK